MAIMEITTDLMRTALDSHPTLALLKAYSRDWGLPLFAEHLGQVDGSVSAEWFHERVAEARELAPEWQRPPAVSPVALLAASAEVRP